MDILKEYIPTSETERKYKDEMLKLFESKGAIAFSRENTEAHFTASAWIVEPNSNEVLLLHHKKLNKWLQPGGHADGQTNLESVSRREALEETSLDNLELGLDGIFDIDIHIIPENKGVAQHYHYDLRFLYFCSDKNKTEINSESNSFKWIEIDKIKSLTSEPSILRMVDKTKLFLNES